MRNSRPNTDGFIIPRRPAPAGSRPTLDAARQPLPPKFLNDAKAVEKNTPDNFTRAAEPQTAHASQADSTLPTPQLNNMELILDTPKGAEDTTKGKKPSRRDRRKQKEKTLTGKRKWIKRAIIIAATVILVAGLALAGYFAWKFLVTGSKIFKGNVVNALFNQGKPLQQDANGRTNILLFGTSEDDPGHPGGELTDSIMIASINQTKKDAFLISVPRDLWVDYGRQCPAGYQGKINALYQCVKDVNGEDAGQQALRQKVGEVFGLDMQYAVHVNYTALRESVDAVGGITVTIDSPDPRGVLDRNFDWDCPKGPQTCYNVKYPNGPVNLNGKQALYLARARGDDPQGRTYGFPQANFDREKYQREILVALKDKAVSAGVLANPVKVNNLLDALGNNVRTNFSADEIKTLVSLGKEINTSNITSVELNDKDNPLVTTGMIDGQSIVRPVAGLMNYSQLQATTLAYATGNLVGIEKAPVDVLNATTTTGRAQTEADTLTSAGFTIGRVSNAPTSLDTAPIQLYDLSNGKKPNTLKKLQTTLGVTAKPGAPAGINTDADFVVVVGTPAASNGQ